MGTMNQYARSFNSQDISGKQQKSNKNYYIPYIKSLKQDDSLNLLLSLIMNKL